MTPILTAIVSIAAITGLAWFARWRFAAPLCPICLGVGGTWAWMAVARELGYPIDPTLLALLVGASVTGIAFLVEKRLPGGRSALLWKALFIPAGLLAAWELVGRQWGALATVLVALAVLAGFFLVPPVASGETSKTVEDLTRKMRDCC